jgi:hypothetical protein
MGERSVRQIARRAAVNAQAGQRRERQERARRLDALAVELLVALGERDAAEHRAGTLLQTMIDREQLSLRQAVDWLGDPITVRIATRLLGLARSTPTRSPTRTGTVRPTDRQLRPPGWFLRSACVAEIGRWWIEHRALALVMAGSV